MNFQQWSRYWHSGQLTSLPQDFAENYDGEILSYWSDAFSLLKNEASVLDVCTGNGAIAILAQQYSDTHARSLNVMAIDAAEIDSESIESRHPALGPALSAISFQSGINLETMDLSKQFDLVTSQYGVEYTNWQKSAESIARHLKTGGHFQMMTHAPNTDITKYMKQERQDYDALSRNNFFKEIKKVLSQQTEHQVFKSYAKKLFKQLKSRNKLNRSPLITGIMNFCQHIQNTSIEQFEHERTILDSFYQDHLSAYQRLIDILTVSERIESNPKWYDIFTKQGLIFEARTEILQNGEHLAGIGYLFKRS